MVLQDKEKIIVGTIINCNNEIKKFLNESNIFDKKLKNLFESKITDVYHYNMISLYSNITGVPTTSLFESLDSINQTIPSVINNTRNNYYSYFNKVQQFLNGYELPLQTSLNESLIVDNKRIKNNKQPIQLNITSFKKHLKQIIETLEKQDDILFCNKEVLKIKAFCNKPLFVNGYNITSNQLLFNEIEKTFGISKQNILAICYCISKKEIYFVTKIKTIVYNIYNDTLEIWNNVKSSDYINSLKEITGYNNIIELYTNLQMLDIKYEDNLYHDNAYIKFRNNLKKSFVK